MIGGIRANEAGANTSLETGEIPLFDSRGKSGMPCHVCVSKLASEDGVVSAYTLNVFLDHTQYRR